MLRQIVREGAARFGALLVLFLLAKFAAFSSHAQQSGPKFEIQRFEVSGSTLLPAEDAASAVAPFTGAGKDFADVRAAAEALEGAYRARGFGVVQVTIPEQSVTAGVVRLRVIEPKVGKVSVEGNKAFDTANIRRSLPTVKEGQTPNTEAIARNLQLVTEHPSKKTEVLLRAGATDETVDVGIRVADEKPWRAFLTLDNTGTGSTGQMRSGVGYMHSNLFDRDHTLTAQYVTSPGHWSKVSIYGAGYRIPFYEWDGVLDLIGGYSDVSSGTVSGLFSVSGSGAIGLARFTWMLPRWGETEQKLSAGVDFRSYNNKVTAEGESIVPDVTVHPVSLTYSALTRAAAAELSFTGSFLANLPGGKDGRQSDFDASRADATAHYRLVRGGMNFLAQIAADWQARVGVAGQYTKNALVSGEQYGLGGADTVRGYQLREMASDRGTSAQFEVYTPDLAALMKLAGDQKLRLLGFFDTGRISRNHALPGELTHQSIRSAGGGLRWNYAKNASLRVDMARILVGTEPRKEGSWHGLATLVLSY